MLIEINNVTLEASRSRHEHVLRVVGTALITVREIDRAANLTEVFKRALQWSTLEYFETTPSRVGGSMLQPQIARGLIELLEIDELKQQQPVDPRAVSARSRIKLQVGTMQQYQVHGVARLRAHSSTLADLRKLVTPERDVSVCRECQQPVFFTRNDEGVLMTVAHDASDGKACPGPPF